MGKRQGMGRALTRLPSVAAKMPRKIARQLASYASGTRERKIGRTATRRGKKR